jgi:hypothetical protein
LLLKSHELPRFQDDSLLPAFNAEKLHDYYPPHAFPAGHLDKIKPTRYKNFTEKRLASTMASPSKFKRQPANRPTNSTNTFPFFHSRVDVTSIHENMAKFKK